MDDMRDGKRGIRYGSDRARQDGSICQKGSSIKETHEENTNSCQQKMEMERERGREEEGISLKGRTDGGAKLRNDTQKRTERPERERKGG
ncbi:hypothetical protein Q8A67_007637 [Cirrhinus molitorella]|uniref:Uncharacterized protein n=1 Tax=Cirrhinus molitorella TaxID=172907 RepID=A0AA88PSZ7_9TELE|nr:hypothetical protein Q8A67_007637 [Cirrhinus molitorella]